MELRKSKDGIVRGVLDSAAVRSIDAEKRTVDFIASDSSVDSYKTVLPPDKWELGRFEKNPVIGYQHAVYDGTTADPDNIIGKGRAWVEDDALLVAVTFEPAEVNPKADKIFRKIQFGSLNAVSVGFRPTRAGHWGDKTKGERSDVYYYDGQELLEVSVVNIPSNAHAVKRGAASRRNIPDGDEALARAKAEAGKVLDEHKRRHPDLDDMKRKASLLLNGNNK